MKVLIIEGRFYEEIVDELVKGAVAELDKQGVKYDRIDVPGAMEVPQVMNLAIKSDKKYDGVISLGCVIRGETSHYDIVADESAAMLLKLACTYNMPLGNGILTVESREQAKIRAEAAGKNKGGDAAQACLRLMEIQKQFNDNSEKQTVGF